MYFGAWRGLAPGTPGGGVQNLDSPSSNFDIAGIPTEHWSSGLFDCFKNIMPSCVLSYFCPCIMFGQVVVRAQIPLFISLKNSLAFLRGQSGYGVFIDCYFWSFVIGLGLLILGIVIPSISGTLRVFIAGVGIVILGWFLYMNVHLRLALKEKYHIAPAFLNSYGFFEWTIDGLVSIFCLPCSLSQAARHVFQYDSWDPPLPLFAGDPSRLPPLAAVIERPIRADEAGLSTLPIERGHRTATDTHHENFYHYVPPSSIGNPYNAPVTAVVTPAQQHQNYDIYRADGTKVLK